jgi:hypothetical protein
MQVISFSIWLTYVMVAAATANVSNNPERGLKLEFMQRNLTSLSVIGVSCPQVLMCELS